MSVSLEDLEAQGNTEAEEEFEDAAEDESEEGLLEGLRNASTLLKNSGVLFEFLSNPDFCKNISNRERAAISKILAKIDTFTDAADQLLAQYEEV